MTTASRPRIALLPLDDRPVNVQLPQDVANIAGVTLDVPGPELLPDYRDAGDTAGLASWLEQRASDPDTTQLVVSIDMLLYGGLIASRTSSDSVQTVLDRLAVLRRIKLARPDVAISAVSLVMRASNSYSVAEEPEYWRDYGKEIHALGGNLHQLLESNEMPPLDEITTVPADVVSDFASRRVRNHIVNLTALLLHEEGIIDFLAITADDTATFAAGSAEQVWLRHWMRFLPNARRVIMYPGADEVGAVLVARALGAGAGVAPRFEIVCAQPGGLKRVPPYENCPLDESIPRQILAAGGSVVADGADVTFIVHAPGGDGEHGPDGDEAYLRDDADSRLTRDAVIRALADGKRVAVADVRYPNGADARLVRQLIDADLLGRLESFGGWNTAGNTLGGVIASAAAGVIGRFTKQFDAAALHRALLVRLLDDYAYQAVVRVERGGELFPNDLPMGDPVAVNHAEQVIGAALTDILSTELPADDWTLIRAGLPWRRRFEVQIDIEPPAVSP